MTVFAFAGRSSSHMTTIRTTVQRRLLQPLRQPHKRHGSSNANANANANSTTNANPSQGSTTIPVAGWGWIEPVKAPFLAYSRMNRRSPNMTQLSSTLIIYFLGDLSAQLVAGSSSTATDDEDENKDEAAAARQRQQNQPSSSSSDKEGAGFSYEPARGLRALVIGGLISIPNYRWFIFLGNHFNFASSHALSIACKIVVNQMVFTPCFNTYFFGMQSLLSGSSLHDARQRVVDTVPISWRNSWKVWPLVTAFSFSFLQPQYRSVFAGVVAIGWQTYLSWLNLKAAREEKARKS